MSGTPEFGNLVGGEWVPGRSGRTFTSVSPADREDAVGVFPRSGAEDVDAAVADRVLLMEDGVLRAATPGLVSTAPARAFAGALSVRCPGAGFATFADNQREWAGLVFCRGIAPIVETASILTISRERLRRCSTYA